MIDSRVLGGRSNRASRRFRPPERGSGRKFLGGRARRRTLVRPDRRPDHEIQEIRKCSATLCLRRGFIFPIKYLKIQTVEDQSSRTRVRRRAGPPRNFRPEPRSGGRTRRDARVDLTPRTRESIIHLFVARTKSTLSPKSQRKPSKTWHYRFEKLPFSS